MSVHWERHSGAHNAHRITRAVIHHRLAPRWAMPWLQVLELLLLLWRLIAR